MGPLFTRAFSTLGCVEFPPAALRSLDRRQGIDWVELRGLAGSTAAARRWW